MEHATAEVQKLWLKHEDGKAKHKKSKEALTKIRTELAERLCVLKTIHSRAGCRGEFSAVLKAIGIPRSTANRLVAVHERIAKTDGGNCPSGTIPWEPTFEDAAKKVRKLAVTTWARLKKDLTSTELLNEFFDEFCAQADIAFANAAEAVSATAPGTTAATDSRESEIAIAA
jgi:hypothetical protein